MNNKNHVAEASAQYLNSVDNHHTQRLEVHKKTEFGSLPMDWDVTHIGEFNPFVTSGSRGWAEYYSEFGSPFIRITNLRRSSIYLDASDMKFVSLPALSAEGRRTQLRFGDILVSITADIGIIGYIEECIEKPSYINQHIALVRFENEKINSKFVAYFLASENVQRLFKGGADQGAKAGMNLNSVRSIAFALPRKKEQTAIANALSDVDALINSLEKLIAKKQAIKTATMQQLLTGKTRLPQFATHPDGTPKGYKQTELGEIPEDWDVFDIGTFAEVKTGPFGSALHEKDYVNHGTPIITVEHLGELGVTYQNLPMVSNKDRDRLRAYELCEGDIVFSRVGSIDRNAIIRERQSGWLFSGRLLRIRVSQQRINSLYLSYQFHTLPFKRRVVEVAVGQTMPSLNTQILKGVLVLVPRDKREQENISEIFSDMDADILKLQERLTKTRQIKQGMMQELLTGKTRLIS